MKYKTGYSLIEVIISLLIVFSTLSLCLFSVWSYNEQNNLYDRQYSAILYEYNLIQIIKSDNDFIHHADRYLDTSLCSMNLNLTPPQIIIYLDRKLNQCDQGLYDVKFIINCSINSSLSYSKYAYTIQKYEKSTNNVDSLNGGTISVTVLEA